MLTQQRLRELLHYDPMTGVFVWKVKMSNAAPSVGEVAGCDDGMGYLRIRVDRKKYKAHRLAWLHVYGEFPENGIDHINGDRSDNRIANLRPATQHQNCMNTPRRSTNSSGVKGVYWNSKNNNWRALIMVYGKQYNLGSFASLEEATAARQGAAALAFGEFAHAHDNTPAQQPQLRRIK